MHFHVFEHFIPSWIAAFGLSHFWSQMAIEIADLPDSRFAGAEFASHMSLGPEYGLALQLEVFNMGGGPITREFLLIVAGEMMHYTMHGFCGVFNARLSRGPGSDTTWITLMITGRSALRAMIDANIAEGIQNLGP